MTLDLILWPLLVLLIIVLVINRQSERSYQRLAKLPPAGKIPSGGDPVVDIIVPARNESAVITRVVTSLNALDYPAFQVTVVDDASTDKTGELARAAGAEVLTLSGDPPPGWTGKCNACDSAARRSKAYWLLFTDADTCHNADSLARAVAYAEAHTLDALSLLLRQECGTFWERIVLPLAYQNLFAAWRADRTAFNGQYILIRRASYERSGGFGPVRGRVMEDVALAQSLAKAGYAIALLNGEDAASVRMYQDLRSLFRGMTKTAFVAARDQGLMGIFMALSFILGSLVLPAIALGLITGKWPLVIIGLIVYVSTAVGLRPWLKRFFVPQAAVHALLHPAGVMIMAAIGLSATLRGVTGRGVRWKDRTIIETPVLGPTETK